MISLLSKTIARRLPSNIRQFAIKFCELACLHVEFTVRSGDTLLTVQGTRLSVGNYVVWYENDRALQAKMEVVQRYNLKGVGAWALGQENLLSGVIMRIGLGVGKCYIGYNFIQHMNDVYG